MASRRCTQCSTCIPGPPARKGALVAQLCSRCQVPGTCHICGETKPLKKNGKYLWCSECLRRSNLFQRYAVDADEQLEALEMQGHRCAICQRQGKLFFDHDHSNGMARGWLCNPCNMGLGAFQDDPARLLEAARYLVQRADSPL